ncbi:HlyD family efflux transporter periplasmic adaptor subunit [Demequina soli]|uniref:HlyD family efflux transporter periplasmic adaptor subunit n=1 Tax=Demequina soli TaxID=1638987 RepID=UPI000780D091|nr:HlyD family efflux transporter periplasmic adaptor subunit [Demequina soli]
MTWGNRLKLVAGLLVVLLVVAAATLVFNRRQTQVLSSTAQIESARYDVGTDYGGLVVNRYVQQGDQVHKGQRLLEIDSPTLERDIRQGLVDATDGTLGKDGTVTIRAAVDGTVSDLAVDTGSYAGAGQVVATVAESGTRYAEAEFVVTPRDFARIVQQAPVELRLPDGTLLAGTVADYTVTTVDGEAHVSARVAATGLEDGADAALLQAGTPLDATLHLRDDGPLAGVTDALGNLARRVGL